MHKTKNSIHLNENFIIKTDFISVSGLTLRIYVQSIEYVPSLSSALGIKMVIHNQSSMPFPENEGIVVKSGSLTQVGIKPVSRLYR